MIGTSRPSSLAIVPATSIFAVLNVGCAERGDSKAAEQNLLREDETFSNTTARRDALMYAALKASLARENVTSRERVGRGVSVHSAGGQGGSRPAGGEAAEQRGMRRWFDGPARCTSGFSPPETPPAKSTSGLRGTIASHAAYATVIEPVLADEDLVAPADGVIVAQGVRCESDVCAPQPNNSYLALWVPRGDLHIVFFVRPIREPAVGLGESVVAGQKLGRVAALEAYAPAAYITAFVLGPGDEDPSDAGSFRPDRVWVDGLMFDPFPHSDSARLFDLVGRATTRPEWNIAWPWLSLADGGYPRPLECHTSAPLVPDSVERKVTSP